MASQWKYNNIAATSMLKNEIRVHFLYQIVGLSYLPKMIFVDTLTGLKVAPIITNVTYTFSNAKGTVNFSSAPMATMKMKRGTIIKKMKMKAHAKYVTGSR